MGHSALGLGRGAQTRLLAEDRAFLGSFPQPDLHPPFLTGASSVAAFSSSVGCPAWNLPSEAEGELQGLPEVATDGCGFLPGQVGRGPVGKLKVELICHLPVFS